MENQQIALTLNLIDALTPAVISGYLYTNMKSEGGYWIELFSSVDSTLIANTHLDTSGKYQIEALSGIYNIWAYADINNDTTFTLEIDTCITLEDTMNIIQGEIIRDINFDFRKSKE